ncbi:TetR/AcrR family transcriptional regulator [Chthonobacter albigriseus]|uniref:TetR/AcrR family transcriptional regulator n=1 Tax=Chthonobacter albigriseus TaxID=1683161 RepID=UPI001FCF13DC|nr:TetR/AcrR family transcriptional regulator [Chthonobacter albigriseus]
MIVIGPAAMDAALKPDALVDGRETREDLRRTQILDAARICFSRWGFHGASMHQICREARMSPGALYRYFPSKEAIIAAIAGDERERASHTLEVFKTEGPLVERLVRVAIAYLKDVEARGFGSLMVEICVESIRNHDLGRQFHDIECGVRDTFLTALREGQHTGEIDPTVDVDTVLHVLFSVADGLMLRLQLDPAVTVDGIAPYLTRVIEGLLLPRAGAPPD